MQKSPSKLTHFNLDIQVELFSFLSAQDIINIACTCREFASLLQKGEFWKAYSTKLGPRALISPANLQIPPNQFYSFFKNATRIFYGDSGQPSTSLGEILPLVAIEASSTDNNQSIDRVLYKASTQFWSSLGNASEESQDFLIFGFDEYFVVPFSVTVTFFLATEEYYNTEEPLLFESKAVQVFFGFDGQNWEFASEVVQVKGKQIVEVPILGKVGLARFMKIVLIGKTERQPTDNIFYAVVERVEARGYQLKESDKLHHPLHSLLLKSFAEWKRQKEYEKEELPKFEEEIINYYENQRLAASQEFVVKLMQEYSDDILWEYLKENKYLLAYQQTFVDIFTHMQKFGVVYLQKTIKEKRTELTMNETFLLNALILSKFKQELSTAGSLNFPQLVTTALLAPEFGEISTVQIYSESIKKACELVQFGNLEKVRILTENENLLPEYPLECEFRILLFVLVKILT